MNSRILSGLLLSLWLLPAVAVDWRIDHSLSRLGFIATLEGEALSGEFHRFGADIRFDRRHPEQGRFEVSIDVTSADAGSADLNEGMAGPDWFYFKHYPRARFVTEVIRSLGGERYEAKGRLTVKGVTRLIVLPFSWSEQDTSAKMGAEITLERSDFHLGEGEWAAGDILGLNVRVMVRLHLLQ